MKKFLSLAFFIISVIVTNAQPTPPGGGGTPPGGGEPAPISGIELLLGAGALWGARKAYLNRRSTGK